MTKRKRDDDDKNDKNEIEKNDNIENEDKTNKGKDSKETKDENKGKEEMKENIRETRSHSNIQVQINKKRRVLEEITMELNTLDDLIKLAKKYVPGKEYPFNLKKLNNLLPSLIKLKNVIGMQSVKDSIVGQVVFFLNEFNPENMDMMHTIIQGPPGVGKTMLGRIIGELYYYLGVIKPKKPKVQVRKKHMTKEDLDDELEEYMNIIRGYNRRPRGGSEDWGGEEKEEKEPFVFKIVKRSDLIAAYVGQTAIKTQKVLDEVEGGVLFIDEAYSLGDSENRDFFAKECIDTINQNLSEKKDNLLCIIAGYKNSLDECFFSFNEGLRRRFPFVYTIEKYNGDELCQIFKKLVVDIGWDSKEINEKFFNDNYDYFQNMGGDMETLFFMTKIEHGKRVLFKPDEKKKIIMVDIENAFKIFKLNKQLKKTKEEKDEEDESFKHLYI